jgi:hypothetical protein
MKTQADGILARHNPAFSTFKNTNPQESAMIADRVHILNPQLSEG